MSARDRSSGANAATRAGLPSRLGIAATRKQKGCISYESHTSINDPNLFVVVERWESREDLNAHGRAPHMKVWREYSAPLKVSPTVIEIISDGKVEKL